MDQDLRIVISSDLKSQGFDETNKKLTDLNSHTDKIGSSFKWLIGVISSLGAISLFKDNVTETLNFAESLNKLRQKTGISTNELYSLSAAAKLSDVDFEVLTGSLGKFNKNIGTASEGSGDAKKAFDRFGISIKNQDGTLKNSFDILGEMADQFEQMPDGATKTTTAMTLFGKAGAALIPLLNGGKDSLKEYLGVMDDDTAKAAESFNDSFTKIGISLSSTKIKMLKDFSPSMQSMAKDIENVADSLKSFSADGTINYYETVKDYAKDFTALGVAIYGAPALLKAASIGIDIVSNSAVMSASKMAIYGNELESSVAKTVLLKNTTAGLSMAFKTFAPTAALFAMTEVFLNWDTITGKVYDNLEKISNYKIQEMIDKQTEYIKTLEDRKSKKEDSNGFLAFLGASWSTMDDNTLRFAKQDLLVLQNQINKNKDKENKNNKNGNADKGITNAEDAVKSYNSALAAQILGLEKQYDIKKQIENLNTDAALRNEAISKPEAEFMKEKNDILSQIAKNQATVNLLETKHYDDNNKNDEIADKQKINDLLKDNELQTIKLTAADQKRIATIKATNDELLTSISAIDISDTNKKYQDLAKSVEDLINKGGDLALIGKYATKVADQISREDAYSHLQTELDIRIQIAEVGLYGTEKETALEQIRHDGVMANLSRELDTKKLNADEYLKLLGIENQRNKQNSDSFYKFMMDGFDNINKAMDENFFNAMTGKFKHWGDWFKDFFTSIGTSAAQGLSRTIAGSLTNNLQSNFVNAYRTYGGLSASSSLIGATLSASDISAIMTSGGAFDSETNTVKTTAGTAIKLAGDGSGTVTSSGSDLMTGLSIFSGIKTAYGVLTEGISGSIMSGFTGLSDALASGGFWEASAGVSNFGYGVANPFSYGAGSGAFTSTTVGAGLSAGLIGGVAGYGVGSLGDALFGANTYAGVTGAVGGALGGIGASLGLWGGPIGIIAGSLIGSVLGGLFGKTKVMGSSSGIDIFGNATADNASGQYYNETYYKKSSWFSSKKWTEYSYQGFNSEEIEAIQTTIGAYDYLLSKLGEYNDLVVAGGRFSSLQSFLDTNVVKAFLVEINPNELDAIYQSWVDYAAKIDSTITEAIASAVSGYVTYGRGYTEWDLGKGTVEQLAFTAGYLKTDFEALAESLGAGSVNVDNFLSMYDTAIKNNFTQETIEKWASLGDALMKSTDAAKEYQDALDSLNTSTTLSLPTDMLLQNLTVSSNTVDFEELIKAQTTGNSKTDKMVTYLYEILKLQRDLIRVTKFGQNQGIPA